MCTIKTLSLFSKLLLLKEEKGGGEKEGVGKRKGGCPLQQTQRYSKTKIQRYKETKKKRQ